MFMRDKALLAINHALAWDEHIRDTWNGDVLGGKWYLENILHFL
jgi:hypothetical protein